MNTIEIFRTGKNAPHKTRGIPSKRRRVYAETEGRCVYCSEVTPEQEQSVDHIWPRYLGGPWANTNLVPACRKCNERRGLRLPAWRYACADLREYVRTKEEALNIPLFVQPKGEIPDYDFRPFREPLLKLG